MPVTSRPARVVSSGISSVLRRRHLLWTAVEAPRAAAEVALLAAAMPWLLAAPRPTPYPLLVVPGLSGGPGWCAPLRGYLTLLGYLVHQPQPYAMKGRSATVRQRLCDQVDALAQRYGEPVGLVGWSVGGCLARQVALTHPGAVRQLVTLGTPLSGPWYAAQPEAADELPVPTSALYSRSDAAADWRSCLQRSGGLAENVEIVSSHLGMATHPVSYYVVADRLAQPAGSWRPFEAGPAVPAGSVA